MCGNVYVANIIICHGDVILFFGFSISSNRFHLPKDSRGWNETNISFRISSNNLFLKDGVGLFSDHSIIYSQMYLTMR